MKSLQNPEKWR
uniref:Uncharacterized protein n=1 Tax=Arundo donax TaxID=35708 RepID=A0A0A9GNK3_ARUDO